MQPDPVDPYDGYARVELSKAEIEVNAVKAQVDEKVVNLGDLNREQRRRYRRALNAQHRKATRFHRRASTMPQGQATILAKQARKRQLAQQAEYDAIDNAYGVGVASA